MTELRNSELDASRFRLRVLVIALVVLLAFVLAGFDGWRRTGLVGGIVGLIAAREANQRDQQCVIRVHVSSTAYDVDAGCALRRQAGWRGAQRGACSPWVCRFTHFAKMDVILRRLRMPAYP